MRLPKGINRPEVRALTAVTRALRGLDNCPKPASEAVRALTAVTRALRGLDSEAVSRLDTVVQLLNERPLSAEVEMTAMRERHHTFMARYRAKQLEGAASERVAAPAVGTTPPGIKPRRRGVGVGCAQIDLGLALLSCLLKPGESLTCEDIAAFCGCSKTTINNIERQALAKVRQRLVEEMGAEAAGLLAMFDAAV